MTDEKTKEIIEIIESSLLMANSKMISDEIHKMGLEAVLRDILEILEKVQE